MADYTQKTIEYFFEKYHVADQAIKEKLLTEVTDSIYDYNMLVVQYEKETDAYRKKQLETDMVETLAHIEEMVMVTLKHYAA